MSCIRLWKQSSVHNMAKNYLTEILACLGDPVDANPTGAVEEAAFAACGLDWRFLMLRVPEGSLDAAITGARAMGFKGLGVTMPHKEAIIPYLDELTPAAAIIGAVNAVYVRDGKWIGDNVDGKGYVGALPAQGAELSCAHVVILGAGGAARAIATECALAGARKVTIINRTPGRGKELAKLIADKTASASTYIPWTPKVSIPQDADLLINATSIGLTPNCEELPDIDYDTITSGLLVSDVVFDPAQTRFLQESAKRGARTVSGIHMLVTQAALAFTGWTGMEAPLDVMDAAIKKELS